MENNNLTIRNPNTVEISTTKDENTEKTKSYQESNDVDVSRKNNEQNGTNGNNNGSINNRLDTQHLNPSQALCLMTTVPQNIASRTLGDKHTPTRNSLRHSRMIVMNRNGKVPKKYLPYIIRHYKLVKSMKVITIILGTVLCMLSVWLVLLSPTLTAMDFPYWSAVPILFSGVVGCFFLGFCPRPYPGRTLGCHYYLTKSVSILTSSVSIMAAAIVLTINLVHIAYLYTATCQPHDTLNTTCICSIESETSLFNPSYHYEDLTCEEVEYLLKSVVLVVGVLNLLAIVLDVLYLCVHWTSQRTYVYAKVPLRLERTEPCDS